jgi:hypothetical protein
MSQNPPSLYDLDYRTKQLTSDVLSHTGEITALQSSMTIKNNNLIRQRKYLKTLLICKAELKLPTNIDEYVSMLCTLYKKEGPIPPDMDKDTTPAWMIADAVLNEPNDNDRAAYTDIFKYVYGYTPLVFFV